MKQQERSENPAAAPGGDKYAHCAYLPAVLNGGSDE
jgi:hypothetical protein